MDNIGHHPVSQTKESFDSLGLSRPSLKLLEKIGFEHPTPIQYQIIPPALEKRDLIGLAQTGSGKTAAFVLPMAESLQHADGLRGLILSPTREIALQTKAFLDHFGRYHNLETACIIGGMPIYSQTKALRNNPDIVVATPGRLKDHMQRGNVSLDKIEILVLDEADHMLDLGFLPQIREIVKRVPTQRHTMMFSATMPNSIEKLAQQYLKDPKRIDVLPEGRAAEGITHRLYLVEASDKKNCLVALLQHELGSTLVFTRTRRDADWVMRMLKKHGHPVTNIHSDRTQRERIKALEGFRAGKHRILVATAIASRGIDVKGIEHVVNFDIPETVDEYIHRAGRTARAGSLGMVSSIGTWLDKKVVNDIEKAINQTLPRCSIAGVEPYVEIKPKSFRGRGSRGRGRRPSRRR